MCVRRTLSTEEFARDVEGLGSDHDDLLAVQELLCDGAGETTKEMALAVNDNLHGESHVSRGAISKCAGRFSGRQRCSLRTGEGLTTGSNVDILPSESPCKEVDMG
jgi:hypothetical protein